MILSLWQQKQKNMKKQITIEQGQELRRLGMYLITDRTISKVLGVADSYEAAKKIKNGKIWGPLRKMEWTKRDTEKALQELALGLQCNI